jgi:TP901 family phage tail tape measure protein
VASGNSVIIRITGDDSDFSAKLKGAAGKAKTAFKGMGRVAVPVLKGIGAAVSAVSGALTGMAIAAAHVGAPFETAFAKTQTIMDTSAVSVAQMRDDILGLSNEMGIAASELSDSVYNAISATGDTANAVSLVWDASRLASAGFTDSASALGVLTTAINAYGMAATDAEKISDSLIMTQNLGVTTVAELSAGMGKAIATASAYGIDLYNVESSYISLTKAGINTAEATTYMASMFNELGDSGSEASKLLLQVSGKSFAQLMAEGASVADVLGLLYTACNRDSTALMNLWGSAEAGKASNAIVNQGLETFNDNLGALQNSAGTTAVAYETMCDTFEHQTALLKTNVQNLGIALYDGLSGVLTDNTARLNEWVVSLSNGFQRGGVDGLINAFADVLPQAIGKLSELLQTAGNALAKYLPVVVKNLMKAVPGALKAATVIIPQITEAAFEGLSAVVSSLITMLPELVPMLLEGIVNLVKSLISGLGKVLYGLGESIFDLIVGDHGPRSVGEAWDAVLEKGRQSGETLTLTADVDATIETEKAVSAIRTAFQTIRDALAGYDLGTETIIELIGQDYDAIYAALLSFGLSESDAAAVANQVTGLNDTIADALSGLSIQLSPADFSRLVLEAGGSKVQFMNAISAMGLKPEDIEQLGSMWDDVVGSIADRVPSVFKAIVAALTDGKADTVEVITEIKNLLAALTGDATYSIDAYIASLDPSDANYQSLLAQAEADKQTLEELAQAGYTWIDTYAGQSTEMVRMHLSELEEIEARIDGITGKYVEAHSAVTTVGENAFYTVRSGAKVDAGDIDLAFTWSYNGFKTASQARDDEFERAKQELQAEHLSKEQYDIRLKNLQVDLDTDKEQLRQQYEAQLRDLFQGLGDSQMDDASRELIDGALGKLDLANAAQQWIDENTDDLGVVDMSKIPEALRQQLYDAGFYVSSETLSAAELQGFWNDPINALRAAAGEAIANADWGMLSTVLADALDNGLFDGTEWENMDPEKDAERFFRMIFGDLEETAEDSVEPIEVQPQVEVTPEVTTDPTTGQQVSDSVAETVGVDTSSPVEVTQPVDVTVETKTTDESGVAKAVNKELEAQTMDVSVKAAVSLEVEVSDSNAAEVGEAAGAEIGAGVAAGLKGQNRAIRSAGSMAGEGFARGLLSRKAQILAAVRSITGDVVREFKRTLEIRSPSHVMRRLGAFTGAGYDQGLQDSMRDILRTARGITTGLVGALNVPYHADLRATAAASDADSETTAESRDVRLYVNGRELARTTAKDTKIAQNARNRRLAVGVGGSL